jgi:hypothetical protein
VFNDNTPREKVLLQQKVMHCARELDLNWFAVSDDDWGVHIAVAQTNRRGGDTAPYLATEN